MEINFESDKMLAKESRCEILVKDVLRKLVQEFLG